MMNGARSRTWVHDDEMERLAPVGLSDSTLDLVGASSARSYEFGLARRRRVSEGLVHRLTRLRRQLRSHRVRADGAPRLSTVLSDADLSGADRQTVVGLQFVQTARVDLAADTVEVRRRVAEVAADLEQEGFSPTDFGLPLAACARRRVVDAEEAHAHEIALLRRLRRAAER